MDMFSRRRRTAVFVLSLLLFLCFVLLYAFSLTSSAVTTESEGSVGCDDTCRAYFNRLDGYCHQTLLNVSWQRRLSHEGRLDDEEISDTFKLVHAHVMIRHGDRTPVYAYKIGYPIFYECGLIDTQLNWDGLRDFPPVVPIPVSATLHNQYLQLHPGVNIRRCGVGMLTQIGFKQHRSLGLLLQTKYRSLLGNFSSSHFSSQDVFAQSTDVPRTIQSAASFLLGFLPDNSSLRRSTKLHISAGTINHKPPPGIKKVYPSCHGFYDLLDAELVKSGYYLTEKMVFHPLMERLCKMFHIPNPNQPIVARLFDHFMTRGCHNRDDPLPCYRDECVDFPYALKLFDFNDWNWSHRLPRNSSTVCLLPFLRHSVLEPMLKVAAQTKTHINAGGDKDPYTFKFMLTLSHDDTIMMLLNALGYHLDKWIPYASRIVFELWRKENFNKHYVRILFNGESITVKTFPGKGSITVKGELINLENWKEFLTTGQFRDLTTYNKVCRN